MMKLLYIVFMSSWIVGEARAATSFDAIKYQGFLQVSPYGESYLRQYTQGPIAANVGLEEGIGLLEGEPNYAVGKAFVRGTSQGPEIGVYASASTTFVADAPGGLVALGRAGGFVLLDAVVLTPPTHISGATHIDVSPRLRLHWTGEAERAVDRDSGRSRDSYATIATSFFTDTMVSRVFTESYKTSARVDPPWNESILAEHSISLPVFHTFNAMIGVAVEAGGEALADADDTATLLGFAVLPGTGLSIGGGPTIYADVDGFISMPELAPSLYVPEPSAYITIMLGLACIVVRCRPGQKGTGSPGIFSLHSVPPTIESIGGRP
jgi:hypothetical protein